MHPIESLTIRRILDSRGNETVEVDIRVGAVLGRAAAASGASTGKYEPAALPKGGVSAAIREFRSSVAPRLRGTDVSDQVGIDAMLRSIDGTNRFERLGGNIATAVSIAAAKAAASIEGSPLFRHVAGGSRVSLPVPLGNVIGGGRHAIGGTTIQEFLVVSRGPSVTESIFANARVHAEIRDALTRRFPNEPLGRGDEGAWVARLGDEDALALLADACKSVEREVGFSVSPALDLAASEFFREGKYRYRDRILTREGQIEFVETLVRKYALFSVEDPFDQEDFEAFAELTKRVGDRCKVIGDDLFVTDVSRLRRGVETRAANAILIKPNQIGTLSDTRAAVQLAHKSGYATVMSHRSGETTDDAIAHLAVGWSCLGIKTGAVGGERIAKLNELIRIEEQLQEGG